MKAKHGLRVSEAASWTLLGLGSGAIVASVVYVSSILALAGLGMVFWGAILLYVQPEEYVKKVLLDAVLTGAFVSLSRVMQELNYGGKATYLPPKYFEDPEDSRLYISKQEGGRLPPSGLAPLKRGKEIFVRGTIARGVLLTPPGAELASLLEKTLGVSFIKVDVEYLMRNLARAFVEDLGIAEGLEIETDKTVEKTGLVSGSQKKDRIIHLKVTNSIFEDLWKENRDLSYVFGKTGSPVCSAIACALAKTTGGLVSIANMQVSPDGKVLEAEYRILEALELGEKVKPALEEVAEAARPVFTIRGMDVVSFSAAALGAAFLCVVAYWTWFDVIIGGKSFLLVFFGDRGLEGLGIGMKVSYYFVIGLALLLFGIVMSIRRLRRPRAVRKL
jgi:hypothetical protein